MGKKRRGIFYDWCDAICADAEGNVYVAGYFLSPEISFDNNVLVNRGGSDVFLVKYDKSGNVIWAKSGAGVSGYYGQRVCTDTRGNIYTTGTFKSRKIIFDSVALPNFKTGTLDIFVTRYDSSGKLMWATTIGGSQNEEAFGITTDLNDNVYITGYFNSSAIKVGRSSLPNHGIAGDIFIIKYDSEGTVVWGREIGGNNDDNGLCISANNSNLYIAGDFMSGAIIFGNDTLTNAGPNYNFFLASMKIK